VADNEQPDRRDLTPYSAPPPAPPPVDPEQARQYEQFQQFQQFIRFQEAQGLPTAPPKPKPLWRKILFSKSFRRLAMFAVVIIGLIWAYNHYFGTNPSDDGLGTQGGLGPGTGEEGGRRAENPNAAITHLYTLVSRGDGREACTLFSMSAAQQFAVNFDAPDCQAAVTKLAGKVDPAVPNPRIKWSGLSKVTVSSCTDLRTKPATTRLGKFEFTQFDNGWEITGHEPEADPCPAPTTTTTTSR
jgi:hypothetical protein